MDSESVHVDPDSISTSLLNGIRANAPLAWERMVRIYGPLVYQWCRQAGFQPADARDTVQEVMISVLNGIENFKREKPEESFRGWLWVLTRRRQIDQYRKRMLGKGGDTAQFVDQFPQAPPAEVTESSKEQSRLLFRILDMVKGDFRPHTWQAFWSTVVDGRSAVDVADDLEMTAVAVRQARFRVLTRVRNELEMLGNE